MSSKDRFNGWEEHLVVRAQRGEAIAFELLSDLHRDAVFHHALRMLRDREDASDVAQETFVKAFRALGSFDTKRPLLPWLMRICTNCCVDTIRHRKRSAENIEPYERTLADDSKGADAHCESAFSGELVRDAIDRLPERYRDIVMMRHFRHMDVLEIAAEVGRPEGTVKSWLHRARALLRKDLEPALS